MWQRHWQFLFNHLASSFFLPPSQNQSLLKERPMRLKQTFLREINSGSALHIKTTSLRQVYALSLLIIELESEWDRGHRDMQSNIIWIEK